MCVVHACQMRQHLHTYASVVRLSSRCVIPVSVNKNNPPDKKTFGNIGFHSTKSGTRDKFLAPDRSATPRARAVFVHGHRSRTAELLYIYIYIYIERERYICIYIYIERERDI